MARPLPFRPVDEGADVDRLLADLSRWMADQRVSEAARGRTRERWLRQQATESARLSGLALDLAERRVPVAVRTTVGRVIRGAIVAVAEDFWVVDGTAGTTMVTLGSVTTVRSQPGAVPVDATGERDTVLDMRFADALAALAGDRPRVRLAIVGETDLLLGELRAVGLDMLTIRTDGAPASSVYVALSCVTECSIFGSG